MNWHRLLRRSDEPERELDAELRDHLERLSADYVAAGMSADEARRRARLEFGGLDQTKAACRDQWRLAFLNGVGHDVRLAFRSLRATPIVTGVAILSLALGIGANTAIFSLVNRLILKSLPVVDPQRLAILSSVGPAGRGARAPGWTFATWVHVQQQPQMFDGALAWNSTRFNLATGGEMEQVDGLYTSGDFFATLGVPALIGRTFTAADDLRGGGPDGPVAVISSGFWQRRFNGAASASDRPSSLTRCHSP
jgi:hypothetical protein